ncbi:unnamed protein product [Leptosia nina]|uniref:Uncharacterized protein n=1 Tax=Leptosia nina TaxID=320188 RepID=A0AAV1IT85_9NEOP
MGPRPGDLAKAALLAPFGHILTSFDYRDLRIFQGAGLRFRAPEGCAEGRGGARAWPRGGDGVARLFPNLPIFMLLLSCRQMKVTIIRRHVLDRICKILF